MGRSFWPRSSDVPKKLSRLVLVTPGAVEALGRAGTTPDAVLRRHLTGDWGDVDREDSKANDEALIDGGRLLSSYRLPGGAEVLIVTEAVCDLGLRVSTCLLLPQDY